MLYMSLVEMGTAAAATGHYSYISYRQAREFQLQQQQLTQRLADLRANPPATLTPQQLAEWERLTKRSGQAALDAVNHLESLKGVRTLFGTKGDEMTAALLEQISQSNFTAEEIAILRQNLDEYPWLLEKLNAKPEQVRTWTVKGTGNIIIKSWDEAIAAVDNIILPKTSQLNNLFPNAKIGYRGSLATGTKYSTGGPFDPTDWDVDAFIVSDNLAAQIGGTGFRNGRNIQSVANIADELETSFKSISGYRTELNKPFTFRVFTEAEFNSIVKPNGYKLFQ